VLARLRSLDASHRWWLVMGIVAGVVAVPLVAAGPGNDLDVANVFRSGRAIVRHLTYVPSRPPGAPVHEALVGVLDLAWGPLLTNLASLGAAIALVVALDRLLAGEGLPLGRRWAVAVLAANPWFVIAATSTTDYVFALLFVVLTALAVRGERWVLAGLWAAAAMGSRVGSITLLTAIAVAGLLEPGHRRAAVQGLARTALVAVPLTVLLFVPSMLAAGGLSFAQNDFSASSPLVQLGRTAAKDALLLGLPATLLALATLPALIAAGRRWSTSWLVRFGLVGLVLSQALFLRFPWKMAHLLPTLLTLVVLWAVALAARPKLLLAIVVLQVLFTVVRVDVIAPDEAGRASGARIEPTVTWGPVVQDLRCRREHRDAYLGRQIQEVQTAWECSSPYAD
jgi:hypothetical protein